MMRRGRMRGREEGGGGAPRDGFLSLSSRLRNGNGRHFDGSVHVRSLHHEKNRQSVFRSLEESFLWSSGKSSVSLSVIQ